ncbi:MAG: Asp-tRNA(Asn)/Glu-tRNA(Gln) amidotransferase subunit GatC [Candidatus Omnitrophica bacterium]|nr:Asp-tRNA(Asn)/Glu-tRNA(Gln) amidotransferase subunit GatC [Candidatus Omnitrophota bacterium]
MASIINKKTIQHISDLARIDLQEKEMDKLLGDIQKILDYFKELQEVDTSKVKDELSLRADLKLFRDDNERDKTNQGKGRGAFPAVEDNFLVIPPVFE